MVLNESKINHLYKTFFTEYPDVLNLNQLCSILEISQKTAKKIISNHEIDYIKCGREYRFTKYALLVYLRIIERGELFDCRTSS